MAGKHISQERRGQIVVEPSVIEAAFMLLGMSRGTWMRESNLSDVELIAGYYMPAVGGMQVGMLQRSVARICQPRVGMLKTSLMHD